VMSGRLAGSRVDQGDMAIPGLVILDNRVIAGDSTLLQSIYRTQAFLVESPELKSRQGVFGSPIFLHQYMTIGQAMEVAFIENLLFGRAEIDYPVADFPTDAQRKMTFGRDPFLW